MKLQNLTILISLLWTTLSFAQTTNTYQYDAFDRLILASDGTNTVTYSYDELGNRTQQSVSVTLSVTENSIIDLKLYPNPTPRKVSMVANAVIDRVKIYDTLGKFIKEQKNNSKTIEIDISRLSNGLYHFVVYSGQRKQSLKVIKK